LPGTSTGLGTSTGSGTLNGSGTLWKANGTGVGGGQFSGSASSSGLHHVQKVASTCARQVGMQHGCFRFGAALLSDTSSPPTEHAHHCSIVVHLQWMSWHFPIPHVDQGSPCKPSAPYRLSVSVIDRSSTQSTHSTIAMQVHDPHKDGVIHVLHRKARLSIVFKRIDAVEQVHIV
jgi:hypothetical protein